MITYLWRNFCSCSKSLSSPFARGCWARRAYCSSLQCDSRPRGRSLPSLSLALCLEVSATPSLPHLKAGYESWSRRRGVEGVCHLFHLAHRGQLSIQRPWVSPTTPPQRGIMTPWHSTCFSLRLAQRWHVHGSPLRGSFLSHPCRLRCLSARVVKLSWLGESFYPGWSAAENYSTLIQVERNSYRSMVSWRYHRPRSQPR